MEALIGVWFLTGGFLFAATDLQGLALVITAMGAVVGGFVALYKARQDSKSGIGSVANAATANALTAQAATITSLREEIIRKDAEYHRLADDYIDLKSLVETQANEIAVMKLQLLHLEGRNGK